MVALPNPDTTEPFGRHRFRGLDPKLVERWATNYETENANLRQHIAALEARVAEADRFAEDAIKEMAALHEVVKQAETDQAIFTTRQRLFREEAAQIVHDAWAEASVVRAQTQQQIDRTQAQLAAAKRTHEHHLEAMRATLMEEIEATIDQVRRTMADEFAAHQSRVAMLAEQRARLIAVIEACTADVLGVIAPLKEAASSHVDQPAENGDDPRGSSASGPPYAAHDGAEALAMLVTTMRRSLTPPAGEPGPLETVAVDTGAPEADEIAL